MARDEGLKDSLGSRHIHNREHGVHALGSVVVETLLDQCVAGP